MRLWRSIRWKDGWRGLESKFAKMVYVSFFLLCFTTALPISNAMVSIATVLSVVSIACMYRREFLNHFSLPKGIYIPLLIFIVGILVPSVAVHKTSSIGAFGRTLYWMMPFLLFYALTLCIKSESIEKIILGAFHLAMLFTAVPAIVVYLQTHQRSNVFYGDANSLAFMMELLFPICSCLTLRYCRSVSNNWGKVGFVVNSIVGLVALYAIGSRGSFLGVFTGLFLLVCIYGFRNFKLFKMLRVVCLAMLLCGIGVYGFQGQIKGALTRSYDYERVLLFKSSYAMWQDHKVFGVGLGNWSVEYHEKYILPEAKEPNLQHPHNIYSYYFATTGVVGGVAFCAMLLGIVMFFSEHIGINSLSDICAAAMFWIVMIVSVHGLFDTVILSKDMARLFYGLMGIVCATVYRKRSGGCIDE